MNRASCRLAVALIFGWAAANAEDPTQLPAPVATQLAFDLLQKEAVVKELKLKQEQAAAVKRIEADVRTRARDVAAYRRAGEKLAALLNDAQKARLRQIILQGRGPEALSIPEIAEQLGLTQEQSQAIAKEVQAWRTKRRSISRVRRGEKPTPEVLAKLKELRTAAADHVTGLLTEKQRAAYGLLVGAKFDFSD